VKADVLYQAGERGHSGGPEPTARSVAGGCRMVRNRRGIK